MESDTVKMVAASLFKLFAIVNSAVCVQAVKRGLNNINPKHIANLVVSVNPHYFNIVSVHAAEIKYHFLYIASEKLLRISRSVIIV